MTKLLLILSMLPVSVSAGGKCVCTCVVKEADGTFTTKTGSGADREAAGESLKKKLGKKTCELSPDCKGAACKADD